MDPFAQALEESLLAMPYNSATEFHRRYGEGQPDPRMGAACIHQAIDAAERAVALGAPPPRYLQDERHVAAVFDVHGEIIVLDPYLLHREPIRFPRDDVQAGASQIEVPAAPARRSQHGADRPGRVNARYRATSDGYIIRLAYSKFGPARDQYMLSRHFTLRSDALFDMASFTSDMRGLLTHPEQTSLSIRAVLPGLHRTAEAILPLREFARRTFTTEDLWLRSSDGVVSPYGSAQSVAVWDALESAVTLGPAEICEFLLSAADIYTKIADPEQELEPYSLEHE